MLGLSRLPMKQEGLMHMGLLSLSSITRSKWRVGERLPHQARARIRFFIICQEPPALPSVTQHMNGPCTHSTCCFNQRFDLRNKFMEDHERITLLDLTFEFDSWVKLDSHNGLRYCRVHFSGPFMKLFSMNWL